MFLAYFTSNFSSFYIIRVDPLYIATPYNLINAVLTIYPRTHFCDSENNSFIKKPIAVTMSKAPEYPQFNTQTPELRQRITTAITIIPFNH